MNICRTVGFSTSIPKRRLWKPSWSDIVSHVSLIMAAAWLSGSPMSLPATRGTVAISRVGMLDAVQSIDLI